MASFGYLVEASVVPFGEWGERGWFLPLVAESGNRSLHVTRVCRTVEKLGQQSFGARDANARRYTLFHEKSRSGKIEVVQRDRKPVTSKRGGTRLDHEDFA